MRIRWFTGSQKGFLLIDPLDGTKEFISRNGEFTINIALLEDGVPIFGVVLAPCLDLLYWGGARLGAYREHQSVSKTLCLSDIAKTDTELLRVVASLSHMNDETRCFVERLGKCELMQIGSSLKICRIAEGSADVYPRMGPTSEWDTAAAQAVLEAAHGSVLDLNGEPLRYGKLDVLNPSFIATRDIALISND